jgi:hypothetical protein
MSQTIEVKWIEVLIVLLMTNASGIVTKIIWDWLKGKNTMPQQQQQDDRCLFHKNIEKDVKAVSSCLAELKQKTTALEVLFKAHAENIRDDLVEGKERFQRIESNISAMQQTIAAEISRWGEQINHLQEHFK